MTESNEKLTLTLSTENAEKFIKNLERVENELNEVRDGMQKVMRENGLMNKSLSKTSPQQKSAQKSEEKQKEKTEKKLAKTREKSWSKIGNDLKGIKGPMSAGAMPLLGIGAAIVALTNALLSKNDQLLKRDSDLVNATRGTSSTVHEREYFKNVETFNGVSEGSLNKFLQVLSDNRTSSQAGRGITPEFAQLVGMINGLGESNVKLDLNQTDPKKFMDQLSKVLKSVTRENRNLLTQELTRQGFGQELVSIVTNPNYGTISGQAETQARINEQDANVRSNQLSKLNVLDKELDNAFNDMSLSFGDLGIALKELRNDALIPLINGFNSLTKSITPFTVDVIKDLQQRAKTNTRILQGEKVGDLTPEEIEKIQIESTPEIIPTTPINDWLKPLTDWIKDTLSPSKEVMKKSTDGTALPNAIDNAKNDFQNSYSAPIIMQHYQGEGSTQHININEMNVTTAKDNIQNIVNDGLSNANITTMDPSNTILYVGNLS